MNIKVATCDMTHLLRLYCTVFLPMHNDFDRLSLRGLLIFMSVTQFNAMLNCYAVVDVKVYLSRYNDGILTC